MPQPILIIKNLRIEFPGKIPFIPLRNVSFSIHAGQTLALVGPSGSGKSVTSLAIMGLLDDSVKRSGSIKLNNRELIGLNLKNYREIRGKDVSMIFQEPMSALNPLMKIGEQLKESMMIHQQLADKQAENEAMDWLRKVQIPSPETSFKKFPHELSGGQKQRVMIAMAMCNHPKLLIADEPTTALDVTVQAEIIKLMQELQTEFGTAILFITHDLNLAKVITKDFIVIKDGEVVVEDPETFVPQMKQSVETVQNQILQVEDLVVRFAPKQKGKNFIEAVSHVSFQINKGETVGLIGESGCGKSTLSRTIMGLEKPFQGKILFHQMEIGHFSERELIEVRKRIQIVFQDPLAALNPRIKVGEAIGEPIRVHRLANYQNWEQIVENLLEEVDLPKTFFDKYPHELSGGQRQRICIARALSLNPELLICDESVSALDVQSQDKVLKLLQRLQEERNLTYLFVSHDLNVIQTISDRILVMKDGKIVEMGTTAEIIENPKQEYTKTLLAAIPRPDN